MKKAATFLAVLAISATTLAAPVLAETVQPKLTSTAAATKELPAPTGVKAAVTDGYDNIPKVGDSNAGVKITWDEVEGADKYYVSVLPPGALSFANTAYDAVEGDTNAAYIDYAGYSESGIFQYTFKPDSEYQFKVTAVKTVNGKETLGKSSEPVTVRTPKIQAPKAVVKTDVFKEKLSPIAESPVAVTDSATIRFTNVAWSNGHYEIFQLTPGDEEYKQVDALKISSSYGEDYNVTGLTAGTEYKFKARAVEVIDGATVKSDFSEPVTVTTAKEVFSGANADKIVGVYFTQSDGEVGLFSGDGCAGYWEETYTSNRDSFSYVSKLRSDGAIEVRYIGKNFAGAVVINKDGQFELTTNSAHDFDHLIPSPPNSVSEADIYGKTFQLGTYTAAINGDKFSYVEFDTRASRTVRPYAFKGYTSNWYSYVPFTTKILSANELQITANVPEDAGTGVYTFVYDKSKDDLTVTSAPTEGRNLLAKGTELKAVPVTIDDLEGKLLSFNYYEDENTYLLTFDEDNVSQNIVDEKGVLGTSVQSKITVKALSDTRLEIKTASDGELSGYTLVYDKVTKEITVTAAPSDGVLHKGAVLWMSQGTENEDGTTTYSHIH
ncbi:hypothetical protein AGMMS49975_25750 [Clostridia bacterium]|nr:hypothetical protein AGMMS49975_25750 [Clostridia bacterium]